jgi:glycosyltransferase involved in cell wall biosynthesis
MSRPKIFLLYPYYWPHYKAGGPVQSLFNLASLFQKDCDLFFISLNEDIDQSHPKNPVQIHQWVKGPNNENIYYTSSFSLLLILKLINKVKPEVIYVNGMFNIQTTLPGLIVAKCLGVKLIISPRGMLQPWALQRNPWMKKFALFFLKLILSKKETWHATDQQEKSDVMNNFGKEQNVCVASNIPREVSIFKPIEFPDQNCKIKLVFLSLINRNKNLHLIIDAVHELSNHFSLDIYGPVADQEYWKLCSSKISKMSSIDYKGGVLPWDVPTVLQQYHFFVLPTVGENFGHAIFDSLSCGVPVLISRTTPWQDIEEKNVGYYIDPLNSDSLVSILKRILEINQQSYNELRMSSYGYAVNYWKDSTFDKDYTFLTGCT